MPEGPIFHVVNREPRAGSPGEAADARTGPWRPTRISKTHQRRASWLNSDVRPLVLAVLGPTASGKSALGLALAERYGGEIINCDSTAVYRGFDIGTDKLSAEQRRGIPHHLIDIADPTEVYTAAQFAHDAERAIRDIHRRGRLPILVGGTGFYYRALTRGLFPGPGADEALRARLDKVAARKGSGAPAPDAAAGRPRIGRADHAARSQAAGARAGGVLHHRPPADDPLRADALADCGLRRHQRRASGCRPR